ncbi:hypothetical protein CHUAL_008330 [Chamberlinius hualienensis]
MAYNIFLFILIVMNCFIEHTTQQETIGNQRQRCECGTTNRRTRIVNGVNTTIEKYPWMVELFRTQYDARSGRLLARGGVCGGALVSPTRVITAAHCVAEWKPIDIQVDLGDQILSNPTETPNIYVNVSNILVHPQYIEETLVNDIAILTLAEAVTYNYNIQPICIPPKNLDLTGQTLILTGWGRISDGGQDSDVLQEIQIPVYPQKDCKTRYTFTNAVIDNRVICTMYNGTVKQGPCEGDSGSPASWKCGERFILGGIASFTIRCGEFPGAYVNVSYYRDWIISNIPSDTLCGYDCYPQSTPTSSSTSTTCGLANENSVQVRSANREKRIVGGNVTPPNKYPWMAAIYRRRIGRRVEFKGGATLISDQWVITAATLVSGLAASSVIVVLGNYDNSVLNKVAEPVQASQIVIHPNYNQKLLTDNLGLIKLVKSVTFGFYVNPICLPAASMLTREFVAGTQFKFLGWGITIKNGNYVYASDLRETTLTSITDQICQNYFGRSVVKGKTVCTASSSNNAICDGDKGGPLMMTDVDGYYYLKAVQSFRSSDNYCSFRYPAGNQEIVPYLSWITQTTGVQGKTGSKPLI